MKPNRRKNAKNIFLISAICLIIIRVIARVNISPAGSVPTGDDFSPVPYLIIAGACLAVAVIIIIIKVAGRKDENEKDNNTDL